MKKNFKEILKRAVIKENRWKIDLLESWKKLDSDFSDKVCLKLIKNDTVILEVNHPCWANELRMISDFLLEKINSFLDTPRIKFIKIISV